MPSRKASPRKSYPPMLSIVIKADIDTSLRESEELSNCKSMCGPYHFNLHEAVLASHSDYFRTAFKTGTFKVRRHCRDCLS